MLATVQTALRLAVRNIIRHRGRSSIALSAIGFSVIALLLAGGFVEWVYWATREAAIQTGLGHIQVVRPGYQESGIADPYSYLLPDKSADLTTLEAIPEVKVVAPRLNFSGLISHGDATLSFLGTGVDPEKEPVVSRVLSLTQGNGLTAQDPNGIILGHGLAANLGVKPGDPVVLLATSASGGINGVEAVVRGLFMTESKTYDDVALRVPIALARELLRTMGSHSWVIALSATEQTGDVVQQLRAQFGTSKLQFIPWFDLSDFYNKTVALLGSQMDFVRLMIGVIIVLSISNTLIMNVLERTGEIGTLMSMGTRRRQIRVLFLSEGLLLGLAGATIGLILGMTLAKLISAVGISMPPAPGMTKGYSAAIRLTWRVAAGAFALAVGTAGLASLYPSWKASRLNIVDALRHNR